MDERKKLCRKCGTTKPLSDFYTKKGKRGQPVPSSLCKECIRRRSKEYYYANQEAGIIRAKEWRKNNPERKREIDRDKNRRRRATPKGKLENAIGCGVRDGLAIGSSAGRRTFELLGYSLADLKSHLERLFQPGMTWDNYGKAGWEVDHKIPKAAFNYKTPDDFDFKRCWALENLQPMWGKDNRTKWRKLDGMFQPSLSFS